MEEISITDELFMQGIPVDQTRFMDYLSESNFRRYFEVIGTTLLEKDKAL